MDAEKESNVAALAAANLRRQIRSLVDVPGFEELKSVCQKCGVEMDSRFASSADRAEFREGLNALRPLLAEYSQALADLAGVEDLTNWQAARDG